MLFMLFPLLYASNGRLMNKRYSSIAHDVIYSAIKASIYRSILQCHISHSIHIPTHSQPFFGTTKIYLFKIYVKITCQMYMLNPKLISRFRSKTKHYFRLYFIYTQICTLYQYDFGLSGVWAKRNQNFPEKSRNNLISLRRQMFKCIILVLSCGWFASVFQMKEKYYRN